MSATLGPATYLIGSHAHQYWRTLLPKVAAARTVGDLLGERHVEQLPLVQIPARKSAHKALQLMLASSVHCILTETDSGRPAGLFTTNDFLRHIALPQRDAAKTKCSQVHTPWKNVAYVYVGNSMQSCVDIMADVRESGNE